MRQRILVVLIVAGMLISGYLLWKSADPASVACSIGGGCETVLSSSYSKLFGFPVAAFGLFWYLAGLALVWVTPF